MSEEKKQLVEGYVEKGYKPEPEPKPTTPSEVAPLGYQPTNGDTQNGQATPPMEE
ncbi:MAG: hypothetical protein NT106_00870 [Candidatus Sumerlaeota bacterium]|nr:hypothetical protein [Candidatus Sumerlaeota bacterium]